MEQTSFFCTIVSALVWWSFRERLLFLFTPQCHNCFPGSDKETLLCPSFVHLLTYRLFLNSQRPLFLTISKKKTSQDSRISYRRQLKTLTELRAISKGGDIKTEYGKWAIRMKTKKKKRGINWFLNLDPIEAAFFYIRWVFVSEFDLYFPICISIRVRWDSIWVSPQSMGSLQCFYLFNWNYCTKVSHFQL